MSRLKDLKQLKNDTIDELSVIYKAGEKRVFTSEECHKMSLLQARIDSLTAEIKAEQENVRRNCVLQENSKEIRKDDTMNFKEFLLNDNNKSLEVREVTTKADNAAVVPAGVANVLVQGLEEVCPLYAYSTKFSSGKGSLAVPIEDESNYLNFVFVGENEAPDISKLKFNSVRLEVERFTAACEVTRQMIIDSAVDVEQYVFQLLTRRLGVGLSNFILNGNEGLGRVGLLANTEIERMQVAAITADSVIEFCRKMHPEKQRGAVMVVSRNTFIAISKLTNGAGQFLMVPDFVKEKAHYVVNGVPIYVDQNMPDGKILLMNPAAIATLVRTNAEIQKVDNDGQRLLNQTMLLVANLYFDCALVDKNAAIILEVVADDAE